MITAYGVWVIAQAVMGTMVGTAIGYEFFVVRKRNNRIQIVRKYSEIIKNDEKTPKNG